MLNGRLSVTDLLADTKFRLKASVVIKVKVHKESVNKNQSFSDGYTSLGVNVTCAHKVLNTA